MDFGPDTRVLLTGATGFIGQSVVPKLLSQGARVLALTSNPRAVQERWGVSVLDARAGVRNENSAQILAFAPSVLLHIGWARLPDYSVDACLTNIETSSQLFRLAVDMGVDRIVGVGSCWEYGDLRGELREDFLVQPRGVFAEAKLALRGLLTAIERETAIQTRWARVFYAYGQGQREQSLIPMTIRAWRKGSPPELVDPHSAVDFIHVEDVAAGLTALTLQLGPSGTYNLGSGVATRASDVVEMVRATLAGEKITDGVPGSSLKAATWASVRAMKDHFGWTPNVSLRDGLRTMLS